MRLFLFLIVWLLSLAFWRSTALADGLARHDVGIVLMHGAWEMPKQAIDPLASGLKTAGYQVVTPMMPWAARRNFDRSFDAALEEIGFSVDVLKANGAKAIVIAGHGLGANAALAYGAHHPGLLAIMAVAPDHTPELPDVRTRMADKVAEAKTLIRDNAEDQTITFTALDRGRIHAVSLSAKILFSYYAPDGPANMSMNAAHQSAPVLIVVGSLDRMSALGRDYLFDRLPPNNFNRYLSVPAEYQDVPMTARDQIISWLNGLAAAP